VLRRTPARGGAPPAALHVRGRVLERFTETGLGPRPAGEPVALDEGRDGDGWSVLAAAAPPLDDFVDEFMVEQIPLRVSTRAETVLFVPVQPVALDCRGALRRGDAELTAPLPPRERFAFRVRSRPRSLEDVPATAQGARLAGTRALELPSPSSELVSIRSLAREVTRGAADDRERVARVVAFFRGEFTYEPRATGIAGLAGLVHFLERRAGSCTHYAAAAALMLRTLGLPTRVATGFLALPSADDPDTYVATLRNGHAWFEVAFEGLGWVTCDATPGGSANPALALAQPASSGGWLAGLTGFLARFAGGERLAWREIVGVLPSARVALPVGVALVLLVFLLARRARGASPALPDEAGPTSEAPSAALERLLAALARAGVPRPPPRTLREHARGLAAREPRWAPLEPLVESLHRTRFGGRPWTEREEHELVRALDACRQPPPG
jgi:transglutaminase-like putative cysteine protease